MPNMSPMAPRRPHGTLGPGSGPIATARQPSQKYPLYNIRYVVIVIQSFHKDTERDFMQIRSSVTLRLSFSDQFVARTLVTQGGTPMR